MATTTQAATAASDGRPFIDELYDMLERERDSNNTVILELLLGQWEQFGDIQMALGVADQILQRDPQHPAANAFMSRHRSSLDSSATTAPSASSRTTSASSSSTPGIGNFIMTRLPLRTRNGVVSTPRSSRSRGVGDSATATTSATSTTSDSGSISPSTKTHQLDPIAAMAAGALSAGKMRSTTRPLFLPPEPKNEKERGCLVDDLTRLYQDLQARATDLEHEIVLLESVGLVDNADMFQDTRNIIEGRLSEVIIPALPRPVRQLVRELHGDRQECLDLVIQDFIEVAQWTLAQEAAQANVDLAPACADDRGDTASSTDRARARGSSSSTTSTATKPFIIKRLPIDVVRERLQRRQTLLDAMMPPGHGREDLGRTAMMRVEHQLLDYGKTYANDKTMLLDDVSAIQPERLLVTSDNYAWDMAELADALAANSAVMRNPLTRVMFAEDDVRQILNHPLGQRLRPMAVEQSKLKRGVRTDTIAHMARLSRAMLEDQSAHATPTIEAIDVFMAYYHTLPDEEKHTLKSLKVPAADSHTGQAYDSAILEAIQDAKANRVCYHKIGDFLKQAAKNLEDNK